MAITIQRASLEDKPVVRQLMELYQHDLSAWTGSQLSDHGYFGYAELDHFWIEAGRKAFVIRAEDGLAGFALVRHEMPGAEEPWGRIEELFVVRSLRRRGIGTIVALRIFAMYPGRWFVRQHAANRPAQAFWRATIAKASAGSYEEYFPADWDGPQQTFSNLPALSP